jgi:membrane-bound metal-dependent hydrolase YbcI (DUF457 family)
MMGLSHSVSGLAAGAATLPLAPVPTVGQQFLWVAAWGGFALLPDLDQGGFAHGQVHGSTAARTWGPLTAGLAAGVSRVSGGHRNGTHSLLGVAVLTLLATLATLNPWTSLVLVALAIGLGLRGIGWLLPGHREKAWPLNLAVSAGLAWWALRSGADVAWLPWAVLGGCVTHVVGDMLTPERCPLLWPVSRRRFGVGLFTTSTWIEAWVVVPALAGGMVLALAAHGLLALPLALAAEVFGPYSWAPLAFLVLMAGLLAHREHAGASRGTAHLRR